jgi:F-type H+-transporting ATPase subunit epsilon
MSEMRCVVVTPERTEIDLAANSVTVPLFDGELGILKNHSPLVGRLGFGVLRIKDVAGTSSEYFIEGGFVQVAENVVSVLTDRVVARYSVTATAAADALRTAMDLPNSTPEQTAIRDKACSRSRAMQRIAK